MYTGFCCGFSTLSPWSPAGMSPLIPHPASAVACCGLSFCGDVKSICPTTKVKPAKMPTLAIYHTATPPLDSSLPSYIFFLTGLSHLILRLMIQWPIVSALPDDPVSASFISCKKWSMFCGGLQGRGEACSEDFSSGPMRNEAVDSTVMGTPATNKQGQLEHSDVH